MYFTIELSASLVCSVQSCIFIVNNMVSDILSLSEAEGSFQEEFLVGGHFQVPIEGV